MTAIINKYPGTCATCRTSVAAGDGQAVRRDGRWTVLCSPCSAEAPAGGVTTAPAVNAPSAVLDASTGVETYTLLSGHPASPYQAAVFDHFRYGRGSRIVKAVAGSGKTTTMKNALRYLPERLSVQMLAFNTEAAEQLRAAIAELEERDAGARHYRNVRAGTFHSVGMGALRKHLNLPDAQIKVEDGKVRKLLRQRLGDTEEAQETARTYGPFVTKLVGLAKGEGLGTRLAPDLPERWYDIVEHHGLYLDSLEASIEVGIELARRTLAWSNEAAKDGWLDFDDQLYLVILWKLRLWRNHVVIVDECQDTNPVRRAIAHLLLLDGGRLYAVGDPCQSIYGFTGATVDAMDLIAREFNAHELPLTVSYRCARRVVERAQAWVPYIEAAEGAEKGLVQDDVPLHAALAQLTPADVILCRQTAPLVSVAYGLIARGRPCRVLGKEIGEGLVNLIEQQNARGIDRLVEKLEAWRDREAAAFIAKGEEGRAEAVTDRVECVLVIVRALPETERTVPALVRKIQGMFADPAKGEKEQTILTLSTAHKAKGREWDRVAILRPELMPSKAARQEWQMQQEENLQYVAATRAKSHLIYVADGDMAVEREGA